MNRTLVRISIGAALILSTSLLTLAPHAKADDQPARTGTRAPHTVVPKATLTLDGALEAIDAAKAEARKSNAGGVIAVVDDGGNLIAVQRIDNTFAAGANISIGKARTAAIFKKPTKFFEDVIANGRTAMTALPDFTPLQGGVPIIIEGQVVGAVGVSGASSAQQDEEFAIAAANAVTNSSPVVATMPAPGTLAGAAGATFIKSADVSAAFAKGMPLIENAEFKVHASRRDKPGQAEVHEHETDIIYVLEGSAVLVTGGTLVGGKMAADGKIRGAAISGGDSRIIAKGDVVIVPSGVPHWFKELKGDGPLLYYVVKTINQE